MAFESLIIDLLLPDFFENIFDIDVSLDSDVEYKKIVLETETPKAIDVENNSDTRYAEENFASDLEEIKALKSEVKSLAVDVIYLEKEIDLYDTSNFNATSELSSHELHKLHDELDTLKSNIAQLHVTISYAEATLMDGARGQAEMGRLLQGYERGQIIEKLEVALEDCRARYEMLKETVDVASRREI